MRKARVARLNDLARGPDQDVGIPDRRHAVIGHGLDTDGHIACLEIDGCDAFRLGEGEERIGHEILRVSWREIAGERPEQIELSALRRGLTPRRHSGNRAPSACVSSCARRRRRRLALGGEEPIRGDRRSR